jgi:hypothetical protein
MNVFKTIFVPLADVQAAREGCALIPGGEGMFVSQMTTNPTHAPPATHFANSGEMPEEILPILWSSAIISDKSWQEAAADAGLYQVLVNDD